MPSPSPRRAHPRAGGSHSNGPQNSCLDGLGVDTLFDVVAACSGTEICALLALCKGIRANLTSAGGQEHFRRLSVEAFGDVCLQRDAGPDGAAPKPWSAYYLRRVSHVAARPPLSPLDLVQERHARNAFTLLASVQLCSRTSGGALVRGVIDAFMELYPTPQSVLSADAAALRALLLPLGLNRERTLARFALEFATKPWRDPSELHGCGKLAADSWRIFCLGQLSRCARDAQADPALRAYCRAMASYDEEGAGSATAAAAPAAAARRKRAGGGGSGGARKRGSSVKRGGAEGSAPMGRRSPRLVSAAGGPLATADVAVTGKARGGQKRSRH